MALSSRPGGRAPSGGRAGRGGNRGPGRGGNRGPFSGGLYDPSQSLSGRSLWRAARGIANAQVQGPITQLAAQRTRNLQQGAAAQGQTFAYYMQLAKDAQAAVDQERQIGQGLNTTLQGIGQG